MPVLTVKVDAETYKKVLQGCLEMGDCTITDYVRAVVKAEIEEREKRKKKPEVKIFG